MSSCANSASGCRPIESARFLMSTQPSAIDISATAPSLSATDSAHAAPHLAIPSLAVESDNGVLALWSCRRWSPQTKAAQTRPLIEQIFGGQVASRKYSHQKTFFSRRCQSRLCGENPAPMLLGRSLRRIVGHVKVSRRPRPRSSTAGRPIASLGSAPSCRAWSMIDAVGDGRCSYDFKPITQPPGRLAIVAIVASDDPRSLSPISETSPSSRNACTLDRA